MAVMANMRCSGREAAVIRQLPSLAVVMALIALLAPAGGVQAAERGKPVRLLFSRQESSMCSEMVVFDKIDKSAKLPEGETVAIEFTPEETGEISFQCQMGMLRGKLVVTA